MNFVKVQVNTLQQGAQSSKEHHCIGFVHTSMPRK